MFNFKIDDAAKYVALISAGLYAAGFLIVNANLASYGDFDPDFSSSRYVFAGFLFFWFLIPFFFFVLKCVIDLRSIDDVMAHLEKTNRLLFWVVGFQLIFLAPVARICVAALFFASTTIPTVRVLNTDKVVVYAIFGLSEFVLRNWNTDRRILFLIVTSLLQLTCIVAFIKTSDLTLQLVAMSYFPGFIMFVFAMSYVFASKKDFESRSMVTYYAVTSISLIVSFGTQIYGHVAHQYGGGLPVSVTVYTKSDIGTSELTKTASGGFLIDMIALNDKKLIGISGGKLAIINADSIASVIYP